MLSTLHTAGRKGASLRRQFVPWFERTERSEQKLLEIVVYMDVSTERRTPKGRIRSAVATTHPSHPPYMAITLAVSMKQEECAHRVTGASFNRFHVQEPASDKECRKTGRTYGRDEHTCLRGARSKSLHDVCLP